MRRRAWWSALKIFFATVLGITHRVAARVSKSLRQLFLKRFFLMLESGIDPATVRFEVGKKVNTVNIVYLFGSSCHSPRNYRAPIQTWEQGTRRALQERRAAEGGGGTRPRKRERGLVGSGPHRALAPQFRFKRPVIELQRGRGDGDPQEIRPTDSVENQ